MDLPILVSELNEKKGVIQCGQFAQEYPHSMVPSGLNIRLSSRDFCSVTASDFNPEAENKIERYERTLYLINI